MVIKETDSAMAMLVDEAFIHVDYQDSFIVDFETRYFDNIDTFVRAYFLAQPTWLRGLSMNCLSKKSIEKDIDVSTLANGTKIGSWKIFARDEKEVVFGESMGFMSYRFSIYFVERQQMIVSTVVQFNGRLGRYYFAFVKLLHKAFVKKSLHYMGA
ncbi:MAG: DUF2867 domain-containing protein [Epsilonproteobacteria bacterium]|nr:DUF2867 domain-containing protein [Campylobacterota bacterium]